MEKEIFIRVIPSGNNNYIQIDYHGGWGGEVDVISALELAKGALVQNAMEKAVVNENVEFPKPPWLS